MDGSTIGWIGGIAGAVVGLAGGVVGTWASVTNARTPEERRFAVRSAVVLWLAVGILGLMLALMLAGVVPDWAYWVVMGVFFTALGPGMALMNRRGRRLDAQTREGDRRQHREDDGPR